jgi:uncharacterized membrane protein YccC
VSGAAAGAGRGVAALLREARLLSWHGERARLAAMAASAVVLSVVIAYALHLPDAWWAAISGFISTQATRPASLRKALLRVSGTAAGAALAYLLVGWLAYDHASCCLALAVAGGIGIYGMEVSPHGYAWLFCGATFALVVLVSLADPTQAFSLAADRTLEVVVGTASAVLVTALLAPESGEAGPPAAPGWGDPFGANWPAAMHAIRSGIAVGIIPLAWSSFHLPGLPAMATTIAAVLAVPPPADHPSGQRARIVEKAAHRLLGCLAGGVAGLALVALPLTAFLPWLAALWAGMWLCGWLQGSPTGAGYVGTQAAVVFIITLVQGNGPPGSIMPGLDRFAGIMIGISMLLLVTTLVRAPAD